MRRIGLLAIVSSAAGCGGSSPSSSDTEGGAEPSEPDAEDVVCSSAGWLDAGAPVLFGASGEDLIFVRANGERDVVDTIPELATTQNPTWLARGKWIVVLTGGIRLYDAAGTLRAEAPLYPASPAWPQATLHADGSVSADFSSWNQLFGGGSALTEKSLLLRPNGELLDLPYFEEEPDADGWVLATSRAIGVPPKLLNVRTGAIVTPTFQPISASAVRRGDHFVYAAQANGGTALVDQSPEQTIVKGLSLLYEESVLEVERNADGSVLLTSDGLPAVRYDWDGTAQLESLQFCCPDPRPAPETFYYPYLGVEPWYLRLDVAVGGGDVPASSFDTGSGLLIDYTYQEGRPVGELTVHAGPTWVLVARNGVPAWHVDRASAEVRVLDLELAAPAEPSVVVAGDHAVVLDGALPLARVDLGDGSVASVSGETLNPAEFVEAAEHWLLGSSSAGQPSFWLNAESGESGNLPELPPGLTLTSSYDSTPTGGLRMPRISLRPGTDQAVVAAVGDGLVHFLTLELGADSWSELGTPVREIQAVNAKPVAHGWLFSGRNDGTAVIQGQDWPALPSDVTALSGPSDQVLAADGTPLYEEASGIYGLWPRADASGSCVVVAGHTLIDLVARDLHEIGPLDKLEWIAD